MLRSLMLTVGATAAVAASFSPAHAHFPYVVPSADGTKTQVVFSDSLEPDKKVSIDKIEKTTLFGVDTSGKQVALKWTKGKYALMADLPVGDLQIIGGVSDYGFHQSVHTQNKPVWLLYYPKAILGRVDSTAGIGDQVPLEIFPIIDGESVTFQARWKGKALADAEFGVLIPGESVGLKIAANENGVVPKRFNKAGRYGVRVANIVPAAGELNGQKYEEIRHYATLVIDFAPSGM